MTKKKLTTSEENKEIAQYEPSQQERVALQIREERKKRKPPAPQVKLHEGRRIKVDHQSPDLGWELFLESMGTTSDSFAKTLLAQLACAVSDNPAKGISPDLTNFGLAVVHSVKPRDELEAMLAAQMAAIHCSTMSFATQLNTAGSTKERESAERSLNKLARTFTAQMEALKKYRGGEQRITVQHQHVNVNEGGQAIVGTVEQNRGHREG